MKYKTREDAQDVFNYWMRVVADCDKDVEGCLAELERARKNLRAARKYLRNAKASALRACRAVDSFYNP